MPDGPKRGPPILGAGPHDPLSRPAQRRARSQYGPAPPGSGIP